MEEHFLEYIRNLEEIPEEREYLRGVLKDNGFSYETEKPQKRSPVLDAQLAETSGLKN